MSIEDFVAARAAPPAVKQPERPTAPAPTDVGQMLGQIGPEVMQFLQQHGHEIGAWLGELPKIRETLERIEKALSKVD